MPMENKLLRKVGCKVMLCCFLLYWCSSVGYTPANNNYCAQVGKVCYKPRMTHQASAYLRFL